MDANELPLPAALQQPAAYPHPVEAVTLIETHMSWVFLTGSFAYKVKKPVRFDFVDFSDPAARKHFCEEELRLNRQFAPELYLDVLPLVAVAPGGVRIGGPDERDRAVGWAVRMVQFDPALQADRLLDAGTLAVEELDAFGRALARQHADLPVPDSYDPVAPILGNFATLRSVSSADPYADRLSRLEAHAGDTAARQAELLNERFQSGCVRECHGDLHLSNMVRLEDGLRAFDCLEFDATLRYTDVMCDTAFLFMDCHARGRADLAYAFIDGYLDTSGDYEGALTLPLFARYRSMVRAKVAALRLSQVPDDTLAASRLAHHVQWTETMANRGTGRLIIMCGVSGSGKSFWARQLVPALGAVRIRSDVLRKVRHGLTAQADSNSAVASDLYASDRSAALYAAMAGLATRLLQAGENVIVDAACLVRARRDMLVQAAHTAGADCSIVHLTAERPVLEARMQARAAEGTDPSEADAAVLAWQLEHADFPTSEEAITMDSETLTLAALLAVLRS